MYHVYRNQAATAYSFLFFFFFIFLSPQFSKIKQFLSHFSQALWGLEGCNLVHMWTVGRCIVYTGIRLLLLICPFISSFFFLSNVKQNFSSFFSQELWGLEGWFLVHTWTVGRCIVCTGIRLLLLLIHPFISSFSFLCNFQSLKFFVSLFSRTVRPRRLKLGTHVGIGRCIVYTGIRLLLLICPFISSVFFLSDFQALKKNLLHFSQELWGLESKNLVHIWIIGACNVCTGIRLLLLICPFIGPFFFLSNFSFIKLSFFSKAL